MELYPIIGISGLGKSVQLWHTNKYLSNFHGTLESDIKKVYDSWPDGEYASRTGYQNGYYDIGIAYVIVKTTG